MLEDLKQKAESWTVEMADKFHNNVPRVNPRKGGYLWPVEENGFYHWGPDAVDFYRHDGMIFSVQTNPSNYVQYDWMPHSRLYELSQSTGEFRISQPVRYEPVAIKGAEWMYTEIQYPGYDIGYPSHFENLITDPYKTLKDYIDDIRILIKYFKIVDSEFDCQYPSKVKLGNRILDHKGFFWKDIKYWGNTFDSFRKKHVGEVQKMMNRLPHNNIFEEYNLADYAYNEWTRQYEE
jgi:hypothetical protein